LPAELAAFVAFAVGALGSLALTPLAIRVAYRLDFHDEPNVDYKRHRPPTPYLGGAAVVLAVLVGALTSTVGVGRMGLLLLGAAALWVIGTADDRRGMGPLPRVLAEVTIAAALWAADFGWQVFSADALNLGLTVFWVVAIINAFNLLDNMDGCAGAVGCAIGLGLAAVGIAEGAWHVATIALAVSGACLGFLRYNLRAPAQIYLGDGGSLPLGFLLAAAAMALPMEQEVGKSSVLAAAMLIAIPILDTTLVSISRRRRGVSLLSGGRDHTTHRLAAKVGSTETTALLLGGTQLVLSALAVCATLLGAEWTLSAAVLAAGLGLIALVVLESPSWSPAARAGPARDLGADERASDPTARTATAG
jgi:UDP-GlcNAc:undecaprenyl-phosphate GlcNAc-1-phosphate transferase